IRARRATRIDRLGRWSARHRKGLLASTLITSVMLAAVIGTLLASNHRVRRALESEKREHTRAETSLTLMRTLFEDSTLAAEDLTESVPLGSDRLHAYYGKMHRFYEQAVESFPDAQGDPELLFRTALANYHFARSFESRETAADLQSALRHLDRS